MKYYLLIITKIFAFNTIAQNQINLGLNLLYNFSINTEVRGLSTGTALNSSLMQAQFNPIYGLGGYVEILNSKSHYQLAIDYNRYKHNIKSTGTFFIERNDDRERYFMSPVFNDFDSYQLSIRRFFKLTGNDGFCLKAIVGLHGAFFSSFFDDTQEYFPVYFENFDGSLDLNQVIFEYKGVLNNSINMGYELGLNLFWNLKDGVTMSYSYTYSSFIFPIASFDTRTYAYEGIVKNDFRTFGKRFLNTFSIGIPISKK